MSHDENDDLALAACLSDYEDCLQRGEAPDLDDYRSRLGDLFHPFASLVETRAALMEVVEPPSEVLPREFGPYTLLRLLGRGGAGSVYEAHNNELDRLEAVKLLRSGAQSSTRARMRFDREARAGARASHPHIVPIYRTGEIDDQPYFAMEYIDGITLDKFTGSEDVLCDMLAPVADALQALHEQGIVHRDVKPSNIMVRRDGTAVLMDLGLVRDDFMATLTAPHEALGTPMYMSPEQIRGDRVTPSVDLYGLGAALYHVLAGQPPFKAESIGELIGRISKERPKPLARPPLDVSKPVNAIVLKCLEKHPGDRYADARALAADLRAAAAGAPLAGKGPIGPVVRAGRALRQRAVPIAAGLILALGGALLWMNRNATLEMSLAAGSGLVFINDDTTGRAISDQQPLSVEVEAGTHRVRLRPDGLAEQGQRVSVGPGETKQLMFAVYHTAALPDDRQGVETLGKALGVNATPPVVDDHRGAGSAAAMIVYPRGALTADALTEVRMELRDPTAVSETEPIRITRGGETLFEATPGDSLHEIAEVPDHVRARLAVGDEIQVSFGPATETVHVVAPSAEVKRRLTDIDERLEAQPAWVRGYFRAQVLREAEQHNSVLMGALAQIRAGAESILPYLMAHASLASLGVQDSDLAGQIDEKIDTFPEAVRKAWLAPR